MKKFISIILLLTFALGLVACGSTETDSPAGKWYDDNGKCIDIRSDGTYKLDSDYGTGKWKYLDDNETIEFTDFYGDTNESKINEDEDGQYINLGYWGIFYKNKNQSDSSDSANNGKTYTLTSYGAGSFSDDRALIKCEDSLGKKYAAMIDMNGKILYKVENASTLYDQISNKDTVFSGMACIAYGTTYELVNKDGKVVASSDDGEFEKVLAYGDGLALVFKDNSNVNGSQYDYGIIDVNGEWKQNLKTLDIYIEKARYAGCGIFQIGDNTLYSADSGKCIEIENIDNVDDVQFIDDVAYAGQDENLVRINTNFEVKQLNLYSYASGKYLITGGHRRGSSTNANVKYVKITNPQTGKSAKLKNYDAEQIINIDFDGDKGLVEIKGKDGNYYFTVIDKNAKEMFEPIRCTELNDFTDNKIIYKPEYKDYSIVDSDGNLLAENLDYSFIKSFYKDIAYANTKDSYIYINSKGEQVLQNLYE